MKTSIQPTVERVKEGLAQSVVKGRAGAEAFAASLGEAGAAAGAACKSMEETTMESILELKETLSNAAKDLGQSAAAIAATLKTRAGEVWVDVQTDARRTVDGGVACATRHPYRAALIACGIGGLAGLLLSRRRPYGGLGVGVLVGLGMLARHMVAGNEGGSFANGAARFAKKVGGHVAP